MKNPLEPNTANHRRHFKRFMVALQDYLYEHGWYTQSYYVEKKAHSFRQVEEYLTLHCYDGIESKRIISYLKRKTMNFL